MKKLTKLVLGALCLVLGANAFPGSSVTINKVETANPWDVTKGTISVDYSLSGLDPKCEYKVAFDVTAKNATRGVTNDLAKLTEGLQDVKTIDTAVLFGKETVDRDAEIAISVIKLIKKVPAGQLWENGPVWADANLGRSDVDGHPEYGALYTFYGSFDELWRRLGQEWRVPSKDDFDKLLDSSYCTKAWDGTRKGWTFAGKGDYSSNSIFLPAAGFNSGDGRFNAGGCGCYWSSTMSGSLLAFYLDFYMSAAELNYSDQSCGMSVRAVRDDTEGVVVVGEGVVAIAEAKFWLGSGCESCPWAAGDSMTAYIKDMTLLINGSGAVASTPWSDKADGIVKLQVGEGVTKLGGTMATLPNLTSVNGLSMSALGDLTVIPEDMVLVTKESIQAAKAMTVQIVNGQVALGVSVCSNADITASSVNWAPVKFTPDTQIGLSADGTKLILPIPVAAQQGFMILQSGDAKAAPSNGAKQGFYKLEAR